MSKDDEITEQDLVQAENDLREAEDVVIQKERELRRRLLIRLKALEAELPIVIKERKNH